MGDQSPDLKYAVMPIQSNTDCRQVAYRSLTDKMVCAGELDEQQQGPCGVGAAGWTTLFIIKINF